MLYFRLHFSFCCLVKGSKDQYLQLDTGQSIRYLMIFLLMIFAVDCFIMWILELQMLLWLVYFTTLFPDMVKDFSAIVVQLIHSNFEIHALLIAGKWHGSIYSYTNYLSQSLVVRSSIHILWTFFTFCRILKIWSIECCFWKWFWFSLGITTLDGNNNFVYKQYWNTQGLVFLWLKIHFLELLLFK